MLLICLIQPHLFLLKNDLLRSQLIHLLKKLVVGRLLSHELCLVGNPFLVLLLDLIVLLLNSFVEIVLFRLLRSCVLILPALTQVSQLSVQTVHLMLLLLDLYMSLFYVVLEL